MFIVPKAKNMNGECANISCAFKRRGIPTSAKYFHTWEKSWVCTCCAQEINRTNLERNRGNTGFKQVCVTGIDATMLVLSDGSLG